MEPQGVRKVTTRWKEFWFGGKRKKKGDSAEKKLIEVDEMDLIVKCNEFMHDYQSKYRWIQEKTKQASYNKQIRDAPANLKQLNKALQIREGLTNPPEKEPSEKEKKNDARSIDLIHPKVQEVMDHIKPWLPPAPKTKVRDWEVVCGHKTWPRDNVASAANGPFCFLQPVDIGADGSCAVNSVHRASGLTKTKYPIEMMRLAGAVEYLKMQDDLGPVRYSKETLVGLIANDGWTTLDGIKAVTRAVKKNAVVIQPLSYNGRKNDLYAVQSLQFHSNRETENCDDDIVILATSLYDEHLLEKQLDGTYVKQAKADAEQGITRPAPREICMHFVPCSYSNKNGIDLTDSAKDFDRAREFWLVETLHAQHLLGDYQIPREEWTNHLTAHLERVAQLDREAKWQVWRGNTPLRENSRVLKDACVSFMEKADDREASSGVFKDIASYAGIHRNTGVTETLTGRICNRLSDGIRQVLKESPVRLAVASRQSYVPDLKDDEDVTARLEYQLLTMTAKDIGLTSRDQCHSFYAAAALELGIPANLRNIQMLRLATVEACLDSSNSDLAKENGADPYARAIRNFSPRSEPCNYAKQCLARALHCNLRVVVTLSDKGIANKEGLLTAVRGCIALDAQRAHRTLAMAYSPDKGFRPLGEFQLQTMPLQLIKCYFC